MVQFNTIKQLHTAANADWGSALCWGSANEFNEPVLLCVYVLLSAGDVMASQNNSHFISPLDAHSRLYLYWINRALTASLRVLIAPQAQNIFETQDDAKPRPKLQLI